MPKYNFFKEFLLLIFILSLNTTINASPETQKIYKKDQQMVITKISKLIQEKYVYPKLATESAEYIKTKFSSGGYSNFNDLGKFIVSLENDLHTISNDKQIRIRLVNHNAKSLNLDDPEKLQILQRRKEKINNYGFKKVEILDGNVGYLSFNHFSGHDSATDTAAAIMKFLSNTDALIIDLRNNVGGSSEMLQFLSSYFFNGKTLLSQTSDRGSNVQKEFWTLKYSPEENMNNRPVFILISSKTYSAAEAFSYYFKVYGRATLVGEASAGFANGGMNFRVNRNLEIYIPTKLVVSPVTKTNWSRIGVIPHINIPEEEAFDKSLVLARLAAEEYGNIQSDRKVKAIKDSVTSFQDAHKEFNFEDTKKFIYKTLDTLTTKWNLDETSLNDMGYRYLQLHNNPTVASIVFKYNSELHPKSYNVYGSLADSYLELGKIELAIDSYKKALTIEPNDRYSLDRLEKLREKKK